MASVAAICKERTIFLPFITDSFFPFIMALQMASVAAICKERTIFLPFCVLVWVWVCVGGEGVTDDFFHLLRHFLL